MTTSDFQLFTSLRYDPQLTSIATNTQNWNAETLSVSKSGSPFYILPYHRDRLLQAAQHFQWTKAASTISGVKGFLHLLRKLEEGIDTTSASPLRVRVLLNQDGDITIESVPTNPVTRFNLFPNRLPPPKSSTESKPKVSPLTGGAMTAGPEDPIYGDPDNSPSSMWEVLPDAGSTEPSPYTSYKTTMRDIYVSARERVGIRDFAEEREVLIVSERGGEIMEGSLTSVFFWRGGRWVTPPVSSGGQVGTTRRFALEKGICVEEVVKVDSLVNGEECWISSGVRGFRCGKIMLEG